MTMGKPEKKRRLLCGGLALGLAGAISGGALAAPAPVPTQPGKTTVGVQTVDLAPSSLSYTVPLYLTVAAAPGIDGGAPRVVAPKGYSMKNTTGSIPDGTFPGIAVTGVEVWGIKDGTWSLRANPTSGKQIRLSVGGLVLPDVDAGETKPSEADIKGSSNSFYDSGAYKLIPGGPDAPAVDLPVEGALASSFVPGEEKAAAQFRIKYTVSLLDAAGQPIGVSYEGPSKEDMENPGTTSAAGN